MTPRLTHPTAHRRELLLAAMAWPLAKAAFAQDGGASAPSAPGSKLEPADRRFLTGAIADGIAEVELARIARTRASDPQVQAFAQRMEQDHGQANDELVRLANAKFVATDAKPGLMQRRDANRLSRLSGAQFDRAYMQHMVAAHRSAVAKFDKASREARDAELKDLAARTLPTLRAHLEAAQGLAGAARAGSAAR
jgi:putative membrane protein